MDAQVIDKAIAYLKLVHHRRAMFVGNNSLMSIQNFLSGFESCFSVFGAEIPVRIATKNRGWEWTSTGGFNEMQEKGLTEEQQAIEAIDIYIDALNLLKASSEATVDPAFGS